MSETLTDLNLDHQGRVPVRDGVPYFAEGLPYSHQETGRYGAEFVVTLGPDHTCNHEHDWSKVPEGADPSYVCWNCDAVKFPKEVLVDG